MVQGFLLDRLQSEDFSRHDDEKGDDKGAPKRCNDADDAAKRRDRVNVAVPDCRHSDDDAPDR